MACRQAIGGLALPDQHQVRQRVRIVGQTPSLAGGVWANTAGTQEVLTGVLAEHAAKPDARVAAAAVMGALTAALLDWGSRDDEQTLAVVLLRALDVLDAPAAGQWTSMTNRPFALTCRAVVKRYRDLTALDGLDLAVAPGEVLAVVGFNGAGQDDPHARRPGHVPRRRRSGRPSWART